MSGLSSHLFSALCLSGYIPRLQQHVKELSYSVSSARDSEHRGFFWGVSLGDFSAITDDTYHETTQSSVSEASGSVKKIEY